jgi:alcohol dehydrogenase class IV
LVTGLEALNKELSVPTPSDYGIREADWNGKMALMAEQALASGSPGNNPRVPDAAEIVALYREVWTGAAANA